MTTRWAEKYVGIPFVDGGRSERGADCWGLVRLVFAREINIELPSYGEISAEDLSAIAQTVGNRSMLEPWYPVQSARKFDVAVMHKRTAPIHVGVMISQDMVLHIEKATHSVIMPVAHPAVLFRRIAYFRHRDMIDAA